MDTESAPRERRFLISRAGTHRQSEEQIISIGYARVSIQDQNLDLQRAALTKAGCQRIFEDKVSGTRAARPGLAKALEMLRKDDTLVVWRPDRFGRRGGGKPKMTDSKVESAKTLLASEIPPRDVAKDLGVSSPTLYRWVPASAYD